jgi:AraC-like DNA-binding protein
MAKKTIGVLALLDLLKALKRLGADAELLCRRARLAPAALRDLGGRVQWSAVEVILAQAERKLRDPLIGLHAGEKARPRGPLAYLLLSGPRLGWALRRCGRFAHLADDALRMALHRDGRLVQFTVVHESERRSRYPHVVDYALAMLVKAVRAAVGMPRGLVVDLRHADRGQPEEFARVFRCPVRFGQPANALVFTARALATPSRFANPLVAERIEELAIELERRALPSSVRGRVSGAVQAMLIAGTRPDRSRVARQLGMSDRTLQRALAREGLTFKTVRDDIVWDGVPALLANPACSVEAAALSAGYADAAGFSRAFSRRMGCSPRRYRARLAI